MPDVDSAPTRASGPQLGIIEYIILDNFMCHDYIQVNLGSKINFVIGHNGSGKSAVLTAIVVALGGKAAATQRATSMKHLIREGTSRAVITLRLRNRGRDAYLPEVYGDAVIVERILSRDGASGYRLRSSLNDRVVSTKRDDLLAICDHMAIQIDNPLNVLSQDAARQFLNSTTSEEKYKFFLKGTQLAQLQADHAVIQESLDTTEGTVRLKKELLPGLLAEAKEYERKYKDLQSARDLAVKLEGLKREMAWAQVAEKEEEYRAAVGRVERAERKLPAVDEAMAKEQARMEDLGARTAQLESELQALVSEQGPLRGQHESVAREVRSLQEQVNRIKSEELEMDQEMKGLKRRRTALQESIEREQARAQIDLQPERDAKHAAIRQHRHRLERLEEDQKTAAADLARLDREQRERQTESDAARTRLRDTVREVDQTRQTLDQLRRGQANQMTSFGKTVPEVLRDIQRETGWSGGRPLGPLGLYVKLIQPQWADTLESVLNWVLNAFVVEDHHDQRLLAAILKRHRCASRIIVSKFEAFNYAAGEPAPEFLTILRVLKFDNEAVKCQLINSHRIEQIILVEQRAEADRVMSSNQGQFPPNVTACYTVEGFQVGRRGGLASMAVNPYRGPPRFARDIEARIARSEAELLERERASEEARATVAAGDDALRQLSRQIQAARRVGRDAQNEAREAAVAIEKLEEELRELDPATVAALAAELEGLDRQIDLIRRQFTDAHQQLVPLTQELAAQQERREEVEQQEQRVRAAINQNSATTDRVMGDRIQIEKRLAHWRGKREEAEQAVAAARETADALDAAVAMTTAQATEFCPDRVDTTRSPKHLDREITTIDCRLREVERVHGANLEEIAREAQTRIEAYRKAKTDIVAMETLISELQEAVRIRTERWHQFRESIAVRAKANFLWHLAQRGFAGRLEIDHRNQRLNPRVQTDDANMIAGDAEAAGGATNEGGAPPLTRDKDPKSLSGGEKSFSTICLLLALWESMGCPIRALDEYDVFQDQINRRISTQMLIESARQGSDTQYILITPQGMNSVSLGPDVHVTRMSDPKRRAV
ncbi:Structural maintenance of chromosomes protein 6 [Tieghemiomyces parasiticus]|uniref:Structural maintenance of chromosomes protein 6 n=1 Tax=Tieghemiomyces parasiticus TaxID=78921 RepID=A0A9W8E282_9FUNG|nr:Structural maintenance of chromosomes protein 6 [Tieghemiomyces parasiticus]